MTKLHEQITETQNWALSFTLQTMHNGTLVKMVEDGKNTVALSLKDGKLQVALRTYRKDNPLQMATPVSQGDAVSLVWLGSRVELRIGNTVAEEDWPIGSCFQGGETEIIAQEGVIDVAFAPCAAPLQEAESEFTNAQYWTPQWAVENVGDCMPFADDGVYHLFYLKDRHSHTSKWGLGAHQFAHVSTKDFKTWTKHPLAVPITHQWEGSICTGSILKAQGQYYAFYAVRMSDGTGAKLSWAVSKDCVHFEKSEQYFTLQDPYEKTSARDPMVFQDEQGVYHMLVTTSLVDKPEPRNGCLAHLTSNDLQHWQQHDPFIVPGYTDQPECSDYFCWNGWYYLIFSNYGFAKYRYSRSPFGPWIKPQNEALGGYVYRVPKTAAFGDNRRIAAGFLPHAQNGDSYAGNVVFRELIQNQDGTLDIANVPELLPQPSVGQGSWVVRPQAPEEYAQADWVKLPAASFVRLKIKPDSPSVSYGLTLRQEGGRGYEIRLDPFWQKAGIYRRDGNLFFDADKSALPGVKGLEDEVILELSVYRNILDVCINGRWATLRRVDEWDETAGYTLGGFSNGGGASFAVLP